MPRGDNLGTKWYDNVKTIKPDDTKRYEAARFPAADPNYPRNYIRLQRALMISKLTQYVDAFSNRTQLT